MVAPRNSPTSHTDPAGRDSGAGTGRDNDDRYRLSDRYQTLKSEIHRFLIDVIDQQGFDIVGWSSDQLRDFSVEQVRRYVLDHRLAVNQREVEQMARDARDELVGFGPIQSLVDDPSIDDIVVNGPADIFVERSGVLEPVAIRFTNDAHVLRVIQRILAPIGRRVDESTPMVDARLPDGSRVNAIVPPIALDGPCVSIRKFREQAITDQEMLELGTVSALALVHLQQRVRDRANLMVVGGTGSGKTTFLNMLAQSIPDDQRVITVEDAAELRLGHRHTVRLETRPPNLEGERAVSARDLVRNALRMRPDRIVVGEVRGDEVLDMLQAMNTGHDGSMTTLHANNPRDALARLELLAGFAGYNGSEHTLRQQIVSALDLMVHVSRLPDGRRRVLSIVRVCDAPNHAIELRELFRYSEDADELMDVRDEQIEDGAS